MFTKYKIEIGFMAFFAILFAGICFFLEDEKSNTVKETLVHENNDEQHNIKLENIDKIGNSENDVWLFVSSKYIGEIEKIIIPAHYNKINLLFGRYIKEHPYCAVARLSIKDGNLHVQCLNKAKSRYFLLP